MKVEKQKVEVQPVLPSLNGNYVLFCWFSAFLLFEEEISKDIDII